MGIYPWNKFRYLTWEISIFSRCSYFYTTISVVVTSLVVLLWIHIHCKLKQIREMLLMTLEHNQHDVIWRLPVWNVIIRRYLALCTLQFWYNLTKISFQGKHFNYFCVLLQIWHVGFHILKMADPSSLTP
jgi:hypothetical protein